MTRTDLGGPLLASVSRSFYLSIRVMPGAVRSPVGVTYLLARTSDTIADSAATPLEARRLHLENFAAAVEGVPLSAEALSALQAEVIPGTPGEATLLQQIPACLAWLESLSPADQADCRLVMREIIAGQLDDLVRFADAALTRVPVALPDADAVERYTYQVAGCVGEFWTRLCLRHLPRYSRPPEAELMRLGREYGQALQLINILRDLPEDLRAGRCYLPAVELAAVGLDAAALQPGTLGYAQAAAKARPVFDRWLERAQRYLTSGASYIQGIRPARVRAACFLPWSIGRQTLDLIAAEYPLMAAQRVKVSRAAVYRTLAKSAVAAWSNAAVR